MMPLQTKGASRRLLSLVNKGACIELVKWEDGSYGVTCDGHLMGVWPAADEVQCIHAFHQLGEIDLALPCLIVTREVVRQAEAALARQAQLN